MKIQLLSFALISTLVSSSYGFVRMGQDQIANVKNIQKRAKAEGVGLSSNEHMLKKEILSKKKKNPKEFDALVENSLSNPAIYQGYLYEVRDGLSKVEKAKVIAKYTLLNQIRQHKSFMTQSIMNRQATTKWEETEYFLKRDLNNSLIYIPSKSSTDFRFEALDWGRVTVASNFKTAKWHIDVSSRFDGNRLEPNAKDIQIDDSDSPQDMDQDSQPQTEPMAPSVPTLTKLDKKANKNRPTFKK